MEETARSLTLLNEMGDLSIVWEEDKDDEMAKIIQKKLDQGIRFFIIEPFTKKQVEVKKLEDIKGRQITVPDEDIEKLFTDGKVGLIKRITGSVINTLHPSTSAKEIAKSNAVAVRQFQGG
ncbi:hypothetical protein D3C87_768440 [compost metagenome]